MTLRKVNLFLLSVTLKRFQKLLSGLSFLYVLVFQYFTSSLLYTLQMNHCYLYCFIYSHCHLDFPTVLSAVFFKHTYLLGSHSFVLYSTSFYLKFIMFPINLLLLILKFTLQYVLCNGGKNSFQPFFCTVRWGFWIEGMDGALSKEALSRDSWTHCQEGDRCYDIQRHLASVIRPEHTWFFGLLWWPPFKLPTGTLQVLPTLAPAPSAALPVPGGLSPMTLWPVHQASRVLRHPGSHCLSLLWEVSHLQPCWCYSPPDRNNARWPPAHPADLFAWLLPEASLQLAWRV